MNLKDAEIERLQTELAESIGCEPCAKGDKPQLLDEDGVRCELTGKAGEWCHAIEEFWSPCTAKDRQIERLQRIREVAGRVVEQTTADAAYALHDELIVAIEADAEAQREPTTEDTEGTEERRGE